MIDSIAEVLGNMLLGCEFAAALIAVYYLKTLKNTYWKWFVLYLVLIFIQELIWYYAPDSYEQVKRHYYTFVGIPLQFVFLFWLYALKSLKRKVLFILFTAIYLSTYFPIKLYYQEADIVYSLNLTIGTLLLTFLTVLEFRKQIVNDDILRFKENKMFYINVGVILFYIGTYPFFAFYRALREEPFIALGDFYYLYFKASVCIMYLLFIASFVWGKHPLK